MTEAMPTGAVSWQSEYRLSEAEVEGSQEEFLLGNKCRFPAAKAPEASPVPFATGFCPSVICDQSPPPLCCTEV